MADYDLGTAHGQINIDYDNSGESAAESGMDRIGKFAEALQARMLKVYDGIKGYQESFVERTVTASRRFGVAASIISVAGSYIGKTVGGLNASLLGLKGGLGIVGALGVTMGGLPANVAGFPKIIKNVILLASAISLFKGSAALLGNLAKQFPILAAVQDKIKGLAGQVDSLGQRIPIIGKLNDRIRGLSGRVGGIDKLINRIAALALGFGALKAGINTVMSLAKGMFMLGAAAATLELGIAVIAGLADAIYELSGLIGLLPAAVFAAISVFAALKIGLIGVDKAFKSVFGSTEEFEESIKDLAPAAQDFMRAIRGMKEQVIDLRKSVQQRLFAGMGEEVRQLGEIYLPILKNGLGGIATALNGAGKQVSYFLKQQQTIDDFVSGFGLVSTIVDRVSLGIQPFLAGMRNVGIVGLQALSDLTGGLGNVMERFEAFTARTRADGSMRAWIDRGIQAFRDLIAIVQNIGNILGSIFGAFTANGGGALAMLRDLTGQLAAFLASAQGQEALHALARIVHALAVLFRDVLMAALRELGPILIAIAPFVERLAAAFGGTLITAIQILGPIITGLASALSFLGPVIAPILGTLFALGVVGKVVAKTFLLLKTAASILGSGFAILRGIFVALRVAWLVLQAVFLANPFVALAAAVILLAFLIYKNWDSIKTFLVAAWNFIKNTAVAIWNGIVAFFTGIGTRIVTSFLAVVSFFTGLPAKIGAAIMMIPTIVGNIINAVVGFFTALPARIGFAIGFLIGLVIRLFVFLGTTLVATVTGFVFAVIGFFQQLPERIVAFVTAMVTGAINLFNSFRDGSIAVISAMVTGVVGFFQALPGRIVGFVTSMVTGAIALFFSLRDRAIEAATNLVTGMVSFFTQLPGRLGGLAQQAAAAVVSSLLNMVSRARSFASDMISAGIDLIMGLINGIKQMAARVVAAAVDVVMGAIRGAKAALGLGSPSRIFRDFGQDTFEGFALGIEDKAKRVVNAVKTLVDKVIDAAQAKKAELQLSVQGKSAGPKPGERGYRGDVSPGPGYRRAEDGTWVRPGFYSEDRGRGRGPESLTPTARRFADVFSDHLMDNKIAERLAEGERRRFAAIDSASAARSAQGRQSLSEPGRTETARALIETLNMPIEYGISPEELVNKLTFELRRVGHGVYS